MHKGGEKNLALPFISSLALLASSGEANFTKPNPFGTSVTLSLTTVAALKQEAQALVTTNNSRQNNYRYQQKCALAKWQVTRITFYNLSVP